MKSLALASLLSLATVGVNASVCGPPSLPTGYWLGVEKGESVSFDKRPEVDVSMGRRRFAYVPGASKTDPLRVGYRHDYRIVDMDAFVESSQSSSGSFPVAAQNDSVEVKPSGNGHLHTLSLPIDLSFLLAQGWQFGAAPALSISSSLLKEPDEITSDAWQLALALRREHRLSRSVRGYWGLCGDYRFGDYRYYPLTGLRVRHGPWSVQIGYPDSTIKIDIADSLTFALRAFPDGNRWQVYDKDEDVADSVYTHEAWRLIVQSTWRITKAWQLRVSAGAQFNNRHAFELENGARIRDRTATAHAIELAIGWRPL